MNIEGNDKFIFQCKILKKEYMNFRTSRFLCATRTNVILKIFKTFIFSTKSISCKKKNNKKKNTDIV